MRDTAKRRGNENIRAEEGESVRRELFGGDNQIDNNGKLMKVQDIAD